MYGLKFGYVFAKKKEYKGKIVLCVKYMYSGQFTGYKNALS